MKKNSSDFKRKHNITSCQGMLTRLYLDVQNAKERRRTFIAKIKVGMKEDFVKDKLAELNSRIVSLEFKIKEAISKLNKIKGKDEIK